MIYLCEREMGFDAAAVGFPSVEGCRAVVVVTAGGLFGFHLNGTLSAAKRAAFVAFVTQHVHGVVIRRIYAASAGVGQEMAHAQQELRVLAGDLNYAGSIYWATLPPGGSSYVDYLDINHTSCVITARPWSEANDAVAGNRGPYVGGANRAMANGAPPSTMYTGVDQAGLVARYPVAI